MNVEFIRRVFGEISDGLSFMELFEDEDTRDRFDENDRVVESISIDDALNDKTKTVQLIEVLEDVASFLEMFNEDDENTFERWKSKVDLLDEWETIK